MRIKKLIESPKQKHYGINKKTSSKCKCWCYKLLVSVKWEIICTTSTEIISYLRKTGRFIWVFVFQNLFGGRRLLGKRLEREWERERKSERLCLVFEQIFRLFFVHGACIIIIYLKIFMFKRMISLQFPEKKYRIFADYKRMYTDFHLSSRAW